MRARKKSQVTLRVRQFEVGQKVWLSDTTSIGKNAKLTPNWIGPYQIIDINDTNAKLQIKNKQKIVNIARLKMFVEEATNRSSQGDQRLLQGDPGLFLDQQDQPLSRPMTRAFKKLTDLKNAATMAISLLSNSFLYISQTTLFLSHPTMS